ncbi:MAG: hypothetical protein QOI95_1121 [Acidimicrobiaceae bacterium]
MLLTVVSALAEGADRLVARRVLQVPGATLEVPLPLEQRDYENDFDAPGSTDEFRSLLALARLTIPATETRTRDQAYERAGFYVVDRCDVLIAIWDGAEARGRGGTERIVERARQSALPLYWIDSRPDFNITEENTGIIARGLVDEARTYNESGPTQAEVASAVAGERANLVPPNRTEARELHLDALALWVLPYFVRADRLAVRLRRQYDGGTLLIVVAGAVAVLSAALHAEVWSEQQALLYVEAACIAGVAAQFLWGRSRQIHSRWIAYRFLAERFRSAFYLALAGLGQRVEGGLEADESRDPREEWIRRAFADVWDRRPEVELGKDDLREVTRFLASSWLGGVDPDEPSGQIAYHRKQSARLHKLHHRLSRALLTVFVLVLAAAVAHLFIHEGGWAEWLSVASLSLPAAGAAMAALGADREFDRHAQRYENMARQLARMRDEFEGVKSFRRLREVTERAEQVMLEENRDWIGVLRFHDFEPHA